MRSGRPSKRLEKMLLFEATARRYFCGPGTLVNQRRLLFWINQFPLYFRPQIPKLHTPFMSPTVVSTPLNWRSNQHKFFNSPLTKPELQVSRPTGIQLPVEHRLAQHRPGKGTQAEEEAAGACGSHTEAEHLGPDQRLHRQGHQPPERAGAHQRATVRAAAQG